MKHLAMIPARRGSAGLPGKPMRLLGGKTLIQIAIECAQKSGVFSDIAVTCDWDEVLNVGRALGCKVIERPQSLAGGDVEISAVVGHTLKVLGAESYDTICCLNPTSPFREPEDVVGAYKVWNQYHPQGVVSVCETKPIFMSRVRRGKRALWHPANFSFQNRQRRRPNFQQNGAIYITSVPYFEETLRQVGEKVGIYVMDKYRSLDIDDIWDFLAAEAHYTEILKMKGLENVGHPVAASSPVVGEVLPNP